MPIPPGTCEAMVAEEPDRFFVPPFVGSSWLGVYLDRSVDWTEIREIVREAYHQIVPH